MVAYFFYFTNLFVGFGSLLVRLAYGLFFGLLSIQRMDVSTLAYHLETWDNGHGAYLGFMIVDKTHTHPIAISFINLLLDLRRKHKKIEIRNNPARDNWHVAYTLINNDHLRFHRKHYIALMKNQSSINDTEDKAAVKKRNIGNKTAEFSVL